MSTDYNKSFQCIEINSWITVIDKLKAPENAFLEVNKKAKSNLATVWNVSLSAELKDVMTSEDDGCRHAKPTSDENAESLRMNVKPT